ncbi:MAG TPA: hypothetical protein VGH40_23575 [Roseiarcus sp.]|jgi:hypothetical protein
MTLVALASAGFVLGLAFNAYGLLGLSLLIAPVYFFATLGAGVGEAAVCALCSVAMFQFAYFFGSLAQEPLLRRFAAGAKPVLWR